MNGVRSICVACACFCFVIVASSLIAVPACATPGTASIVINAATGRVLEQRDADALHYPASLTKLMTLYLVFDALKKHRFTLDHRFRVSRHAATREPVKLGLRPGERVRIRDLILGIVTLSANDAASVLAEGIAGSERAFAVRMTRKARQLGMTRTVFRNASGLPNRRQVTTARDMARLARALLHDFPKDYKYFSVHKFRFHGRTYYNHDHLIYSYPGMDGMKTGFTDAARFNLVSSAIHHGRRLIGVVLGEPSPGLRDREMVRLMNHAFAMPSAPVALAQQPVGGRLAHDAGVIAATFSPVRPAEAASFHAPRLDARRHRKHGGHWGIQVGVFSHQRTAMHYANKLLSRSLGITRHNRRIERHRQKVSGRHLYRVRFVHLGRKAAIAACHSLRRHDRDCLVIADAG